MPTLFTMNADVNDFISPELVGASGLRIYFDLNVTDGLLSVGDTVRPSLLAYRRVIGHIRSDGRMYDKPAVSAAPYDLEDPGALGVRLLANDPDLNLSDDLTYKVSGYRYIKGDQVAFGPYETLAVPSTDVAVNLATYAVPEVASMTESSNSIITAAVLAAAPGLVATELTAQTAAAISADLAARNLTWEDVGGGEWQLAAGGDPVGDPTTAPATTWSAVVGKPTFDVIDYGAVGDGVTDDTDAINEALEDARDSGGGVVVLGTSHLVSDTLVVYRETTLRGRGGHHSTGGSKITSEATSGAVVQLSQRSARLEHVSVYATSGRRAASTTTGHGVFIGDADMSSASYPSLSRVGLHDVEIRDQPTDGVFLIGSAEFGRFDMVTVTDCVRHGFVLDDGTFAGYTNKQLIAFITTLYRCRAIECGGQALIAIPASSAQQGMRLTEFEALGCTWDTSKRYAIPSHSGSELYQIQLGGRGHIIERLDCEDQQ